MTFPLSRTFVTFALIAVAACSSSSSSPSADLDGGSGVDAANGSAPGSDAGSSDASNVTDSGDATAGNGFIQADVDGSQVRATAGLRAIVNPGPNNVQLAASTTENISDPSFRSYGVAFINAVGTYTCGGDPSPALNYSLHVNATPVYWTSGNPQAPCSVIVTAAAANVGDFIEGTFSGTLKENGTGPEHTLANGSFRIARTQ